MVFLYATTITTIHYLLEKSLNTTQAAKHIKTLLNIFDIAPVSNETLEKALNPKFDDYEDSVLHEVALAVSVDSIVTRDYSGFKNAKIPAYTPKELIAVLSVNHDYKNPNGTFCADISLSRGKRHRRTFKTRIEAQQYERHYLNKLNAGKAMAGR